MQIDQYVFHVVSDTLKVPKEKITNQEKLLDLVQDSIQLFELLMRFEKELGRNFDYDEVAKIESVGDIIKYAQKLGLQTVKI